MAQLSACPDSDELQRMVLGKLPHADAARIQRHLDHCPRCMSALQECVASDEFLEAVRASRPVDCEPTKTMELPTGWIRGALATWIRTHDCTQSEKVVLPASMADVRSLLSPPQSAEEIGRIADFRVLRVLGAGGMAVVYEAEDVRLKRRVALKLMRPAIAATPGATERFLREAQSAAALKHEHVVTIYQVGTCGATPFMALELLHGETLEDCLARNGRLNVREVVRIGREIATGLAAAHARGLLHRDIKPANIWLESPATPGREPLDFRVNPGARGANATVESAPLTAGGQSAGKVKILDFGLAKTWTDEAGISFPGLLIGTPAYMAPEQLAGTAVDPRTDLFSLGCLLYRMAGGRPPFGGGDLLSVVRALALEHPAPLRALNPQVPQALSDLIGQLLSKSPDQRPPSAQAVVDRLQALEQKLPTAPAAPEFSDAAPTLYKRRLIGSRASGLSTESGTRRGQRTKWVIRALLGLAVLLTLVFVLFGAQLIRIATNQGEVVIQVDDPTVGVTVTENQIVIHDQPGQAEITLAAGVHQFEVTVKQPSGNTTFNTDRFLLHRGGRKVIDVRLGLEKSLAKRRLASSMLPANESRVVLTKAPGPQAPGSSSLERGAAAWVLAVGGNVTVRVRNQEKPVEVRTKQALPALDFELTDVSLQLCPLADGGLAHLRGLPHLARLNLNGTRISDAGLSSIQGLTELRTLLLTNTKVTDAGLRQMQRLPKLAGLWLDGTRVTDAGLVHLKALKHLQVLILNFTSVSGSGLEQLEALPELETLWLRGCHVTDADLVHLSGLVKLRRLNLSRLPVTDAGLINLRPLTKLQYLVLDETRVSDAGLEHLKGLTRLDSLYLSETAVSDSGLAALRGLKSLSVLGLKGMPRVSDAAVPNLLQLRSLRDIDLRDSHVSAKGYALLKTLRSKLNIEWSEPNYAAASAVLAAGGTVDLRLEGATTERSVKDIRELPAELFQVLRMHISTGSRQTLDELLPAIANPRLDGLVSLDLSGTVINDADVARLKSQRTLRELTLAETRITDAGMVHLKSLTALRRLVLDGTAINGSGLKHLQKLPELTELRLGCPALTELFLVELPELQKLQRLSLAKSQVSDAGAKYLAPLTGLKELDLSDTKVTAAGIAKLRTALPQCRVITTTATQQLAKP